MREEKSMRCWRAQKRVSFLDQKNAYFVTQERGEVTVAEKMILKRSEEIAKIFNLGTVRRIQQLTQDGIIQTVEVKEKGRTVRRYDLIPTVSSYIEHLQEKAHGREQKKTSLAKEEEKLQAEVEIKKAKAKMAQIELEELEGKVHRAEDVESMTTDLCLNIRSALLAMPGKLAVDLATISDAAEISSIIKEEACEILEELSSYQYDPEEYKNRVRERKGFEVLDEEED